MEFDFDDDDNIASAPAARPPTPPPGLKAKRPPTPPPGLNKKRPPTPPPAEATGLLLEFDDDDDIVAAEAPPAKKARPAPSEPPTDAPFAPADAYDGSRPGYVFKKGDLGLGYYKDTVPTKPKKKKKSVSFKKTEQTVDAAATVKRVCAILKSSARTNAAKASKALAMLATLAGVDGGVTEETAPLYVDALRSFAASGAVSDGLVGPLGDAVEALGKADRSCFGVDDRVQVATWRLSLRTARTLRETDDTYDFCAAMKRVHKAVEALGVDESDAAVQRRDAIVHCLKSGWAAYESKPWAKTPVEAAVLACAERRHLFSEAQRSRIDRLTTQVKSCVEINQCVGCTRHFFTKSFLGDDAAVLARSSGEEPASPRHRAGVASMAWRSARRFSTNVPKILISTQVKSKQRGLCRVETAPVRDVDDTSHPLREVRG